MSLRSDCLLYTSREHWQANFDIFGEGDAILDAQIFQIASRILLQLGIKNIEFQVNSIGTPEGRKEYRKILVRYLESQKHKLCQNCKERLEKNPLRVLDCKEDKCVQLTANAPQSADYLDPESKEHFKMLLEYLDELELPYSCLLYTSSGQIGIVSEESLSYFRIFVCIFRRFRCS